jgi:hypothetical protein
MLHTKARLRLLTMMLALLIGVLLITALWHNPLSERQLAEAGRGVLFILLALGLMGTQRLSLALTAVLCSTNLPQLFAVNSLSRETLWLEIITLMLCMGILLYPASARTEP